MGGFLGGENRIRFNEAKIDSLTIRIPLENVEIVSTTFGQEYLRLYRTGEIGSEHINTKRSSSKIKKIFSEDDGEFYEYGSKDSRDSKAYERDSVRIVEDEDTCTFLKYKLCDSYVPGSLNPVPCLQLLISSKIRTTSYFEGLNKKSLKDIHDRILKDKIVSFSFDTLLKSLVSDIDICVDYKTDDKEFVSLRDLMFREVLDTKFKFVFSKRIFKGQNCFGIMFNDRHKATPSCPFGKLYFKSKELYSKDTIKFTKRNLSGYSEDIEGGISRIEFTIKSSKHKARLGLENVITLSDLMSLDQIRLKKIFLTMVSEYYKKKEVVSSNENASFGMALLLFNGYYLMDNSITSTRIFNTIYGRYSPQMTAKQRHDFKKKFQELVDKSEYSSNIKANDKKNEVVNKVMFDLGIYEDNND